MLFFLQEETGMFMLAMALRRSLSSGMLSVETFCATAWLLYAVGLFIICDADKNRVWIGGFLLV